jgi:hypothetical protein
MYQKGRSSDTIGTSTRLASRLLGAAGAGVTGGAVRPEIRRARREADGAGGQPVAAAFEPVISRLGTGLSFSSAWNSRSAWVRSQSTATPSGVG